MVEKHSRRVAAGRAVWLTARLSELTLDLPIHLVAITDIPEFEQDCSFGSYVPACRAVAEHAKRIWNADLYYPVILSANGRSKDGGHRIAKAWLQGSPVIQTVQFTSDPEPDYIIPDEDTQHLGS